MRNPFRDSGPLIYLALFFGLFVVLYGLYHLAEPYMIHYYSALARSVCFLFGFFDPAVTCQDNLLLYNGVQSLVVVEGCDGVAFVVLMLAAVLPFSRPLKEKAIGLLILIPALLAINWLRLVILAIIRFYFDQHFHLVHVYLFQPVMIFVTLAAFILWIVYSENPPRSPA